MSEIQTNEAKIILAQDRAIREWIGEILSDESRYQSEEFYVWVKYRKDLMDRATKLCLTDLLEEDRRISRTTAQTAEIIDLPVVEDYPHVAAA